MPDVLMEVRKRRGPFTRIVIGLVIVWTVLAAVRMALSVVSGQNVLEAAGRYAQNFVSVPVLLVLLLFVIADVWVKPRLADAGPLAVAATWAGSVAVAVALGVGIAGLWAPQLRGSDRLIALADIVVSSVVPVLLCVALGTVAGAARRAEAQAAAVLEGDGAQTPPPVGAVEEGETGTATKDTEGLSPTWDPEAAAGAAWSTAADAARGGGATSWGDDRTAFGWQPSTTDRPLTAAEGTAAQPGGQDGSSSSTSRPGTAPAQLDRGLWEGSRRDGE